MRLGNANAQWQSHSEINCIPSKFLKAFCKYIWIAFHAPNWMDAIYGMRFVRFGWHLASDWVFGNHSSRPEHNRQLNAKIIVQQKSPRYNWTTNGLVTDVFCPMLHQIERISVSPSHWKQFDSICIHLGSSIFLLLLLSPVKCQAFLLFSKWLQTIFPLFTEWARSTEQAECEYFRKRNDLFVPFVWNCLAFERLVYISAIRLRPSNKWSRGTIWLIFLVRIQGIIKIICYLFLTPRNAKFNAKNISLWVLSTRRKHMRLCFETLFHI